MLKSNIKKTFAVLVVLALLVPYFTNVVLAIDAITPTTETVILETADMHEGGDEETGKLPTDPIDLNGMYDAEHYQYHLGGPSGTVQSTNSHKIIQQGDVKYLDTIYCLDAELSFPDAAVMTYHNKGSIFDTTKSDVNALKTKIGESNYNAVKWLISNAYLRHQDADILTNIDTGYKDALIAEAFKTEIEAGASLIPPLTVDIIKSVLTDDDIDVIQQWAIWHFTNSTKVQGTGGHPVENYYNANTFKTIYLSTADSSIVDQQVDATRQEYANKLYAWLITNAAANTAFGYNVTYPHITSTSASLNVTVENGYHKVGPFHVDAGTADPSQYTLKLTNGSTDLLVSQYNVKVAGESNFTNTPINQLLGVDYYVYIPLSSTTIGTVKLELSYNARQTKANLWNPEDNNYQNVVIINRENLIVNEEAHKDISEAKVDLALRKFATTVNGTAVTPSREPVPDVTPLKNGGKDATYSSATNSLTVKKGDIVKYTVRVYNEGEIAAYPSQVIDYIPNGLGFLYNYKKNDSWAIDSNKTQVVGTLSEIDGAVDNAVSAGITTSDLLGVGSIGDIQVYTAKDKYGAIVSNALNITNATRALQPFNKATDTTLDYQDIEVTCVVLGNTTNTIYKNIAEIKEVVDEQGSRIPDTDSTPDTVNPENYPDGEKRPDGTPQDDNDQEIVTVENLRQDLALKKYIVKVNDTEVRRSNNTEIDKKTNKPKNQPVVDASGLLSGESTAIYKAEKSPVEVSKGDTVVFEIRVYNEGKVDGIANKIVDYLPEGMSLTQNSIINNTYLWEPLSGVENAYVTSVLDRNNADGSKFVIPGYRVENGETFISSVVVQIECTITGDFNSGKVLTNVAEIYEDSLANDEDSDPQSINPATIDTESYAGDTHNKTDLTDKEYDYKGLEDDDDFEKVIIRGGIFDLALRKFVSKVNNKSVTPSREPVPDVTPLKQGKKDATYSKSNTTLAVQKGDVVTYTIRVYNEGTKAGYAELVSDYLPSGLGFLVNHKVNFDNSWEIPSDGTEKSLGDFVSNLSVNDFTDDVKSLSDVKVITGNNIKFTSSALKSSTVGEKNLLKAFDRNTGTTLDYKDIQMVCIVLDDTVVNNNFRNIAEIMNQSDEDKNPITDSDSEKDSVNPNNYPDGENRPDGTRQDDNDYEVLLPIKPETPNKFDLALQKFATSVNDTAITDRVPVISRTQDGDLRYSHSSTPLAVANNDVVVFTLRVYNEGDLDGYAAEIGDVIPLGLEFIKSNETNKKYEWKLFDKNGKETSDINQAVTVRTRYLSKESGASRNENTLIKALDPNNTTTDGTPIPYYKDVQIAFRVVEAGLAKNSNRQVKNIAEIYENRDENNSIIEDKDSKPGDGDENQDDLDSDLLKVKYFDLSLKKSLVKIMITENGKTREINASNPDELLKVEVNRKRITSTTIKFLYEITVKNEGEIAGYAKEISDYIPAELGYNQSDNKIWTQKGDRLIVTDALSETLLQPGQSAKVQVILEWNKSEDNMGSMTNVAEISQDSNPNGAKDIDSTPGNKVASEDDIDDAPVIVSITTGADGQRYILLPTICMAIMATGIVLIKKYVLE